ncbi:hypothetical protein EV421DRAFT_174350 [Armillaria borealis]|uniref:Uncharacterized protein n=1 Tax=Armillaria borealis TaxID=47425 RepID=A0AA39IYU4_9AGAR|nr:hypothetical protein EV421DRAFT_174350 [Armillaria borealis]
MNDSSRVCIFLSYLSFGVRYSVKSQKSPTTFPSQSDPHRHPQCTFVLDFHVQIEIMGGFPVVFIGYELEDDALDIYQSSNDPREAVKSLLRVVESETSRPASIVRYDDSKGQTHKFVCCFADLSGRTYSSKEIDAIRVPPEFFLVPKRVKTRGELERKFSPSAMVNSYGADGKTQVDSGAVIGRVCFTSLIFIRF